MSAARPMAPLTYWLTLTGVGRALRISRHAVRRLIIDGRLDAAPFGRNSFRVHSTDLAAYMAQASR